MDVSRVPNMNVIRKIFIFVLFYSLTAWSQQTAFQDSLLEHMVGTWVLRGTIAGKETTHDIRAAWVLDHEYLQFRETSREKKASGEAEYEAIVYIGWDQPSSRYACLWLDNTGGGGLNGQAIGYAKRNSNEIAFLFKGTDGSNFHTTFAYDRKNNSWHWLMDGEENEKLVPFARVTLTKRN
jgi:hypothetical protein